MGRHLQRPNKVSFSVPQEGVGMNYCVVKEGIAFEGSLRECVLSVCNVDLSDRILKVQWSRSPSSSWNQWRQYHSYGDSYTNEEMWKDVIGFLSTQLEEHGWHLYFDQRR